MSLFPEQEEVYAVFLATDSLTTKITSYDLNTADFNISVNIIRISYTDGLFEGEQLGEYRANVKGPNSSLIVEGSVLVPLSDTTKGYKVVSKPRYNRLFKRYKLNLRETSL